MAYTKTTFVNGGAPAIGAEFLNATQDEIIRHIGDITQHARDIVGLRTEMNDIEATIDKIFAPVSYMAFCANVNTESLDAAFGKNNEDRIRGLGLQLAMYAKYKDPTININAQFGELIKCNSLKDINESRNAYIESFRMGSIVNLYASSNFASSIILSETQILKFINSFLIVKKNTLAEVWTDKASLNTLFISDEYISNIFLCPVVKLSINNSIALISDKKTVAAYGDYTIYDNSCIAVYASFKKASDYGYDRYGRKLSVNYTGEGASEAYFMDQIDFANKFIRIARTSDGEFRDLSYKYIPI